MDKGKGTRNGGKWPVRLLRVYHMQTSGHEEKKASPLLLSSLQLGTAESYLEINARNALHSRNVVGCSFSYWL